MGTIDALELAKRRQIVLLAQQIFESGAHYLWGAQGSGQVTPHGAVRMRANVIGATPEETYLYAAYLASGSNPTQFVCAGRPQKAEVHRRWRGTALTEANELTAQSNQYLWSRYYRDSDTVNPSPSRHVFGESCANKLHFDCAGFVRHCYRQVLQRTISRMRNHSTVVWQAGSNGSGQLSEFDLYPADILYSRDGNHVGIATGLVDYGAVSPNSAIHAYYAMEGVVRTPISGPPRWGTVRRWDNWS
jgi:cell wall-associated NlpC family hydrolase